MTVTEYCNQMLRNDIVVNTEYQRSPKVWPAAARSYLIDTILYSYPVPKISLYQRTDLRTRQTIKEIVDGQQRSVAIRDFFTDELPLSGRTDFAGKRYSQLDEENQRRFIDYQLSVDIFVSATDSEIRQVFRRINSYNVPLNYQETRHAVNQGAFKWFVVGISERYSQVMKDIGIFSENQLSRMSDTELMADVIMAMTDGIATASKTKLDKYYEGREKDFAQAKDVQSYIDTAFTFLIDWNELHKGSLMRPYNVYALMLALIHCSIGLPSLDKLYHTTSATKLDRNIVLPNLSNLAAAVDEIQQNHKNHKWQEFIDACKSATNTINNRGTRFRYFCMALQDELM